MNSRSMHHDLKMKLNKVDSQKYKNLRIPEIDWTLNEATEIFIKAVAEPRINNHLGFEVNQRTIDDIRTIVVNDFPILPTITGPNPLDEYTFEIPDNYMFYVSATANIRKDGCEGTKVARMRPKQHDDEHERNPFDRSSYNWGEVNFRFYDGGIKAFANGEFFIDSIDLNYIREHVYIHDAERFLPGGQYDLLDGTTLTGSQDCELPNHTHREIVDIAVLIITGKLQIPDYQIKQAKLNLNHLN